MPRRILPGLAILALATAPAAHPQPHCTLGPSYEAARWTCVGGATPGATCDGWSDPVCGAGECTIGTGGRATFYEFTGVGNCGLPLPPGRLAVAVSTPDWDGSALCGRCLRVTGPLGTTLVEVVDQCPADENPEWCADAGHLDLDDEAFELVADPLRGVEGVSWVTVPCPVGGDDVTLRSHSGTNQWWYAFFVDDLRHGVAAVEVRESGSPTWTSAARQAWNAWLVEDAAGLSGPLSVRLTDVTGASLVASDLVTSFDELTAWPTGQQFPACQPLVFADGFESGDAGGWSSQAAPAARTEDDDGT